MSNFEIFLENDSGCFNPWVKKNGYFVENLKNVAFKYVKF